MSLYHPRDGSVTASKHVAIFCLSSFDSSITATYFWPSTFSVVLDCKYLMLASEAMQTSL